ncbi:BTB/POZ domain-containing protein 6 [Diaphorina citri]|uniref:BTB/POZ domain-containing protein 6 n=1 Tax=Diaphorina citri TaxID=121845 RepID=A0A3Q0J6P2_DIACI|nr:BTB/POZ domain-containing protein 6 [Diaphorina citri]
MDSNGATDWQSDHVTLPERGRYVLNSGLWSDCKFYVGNDVHCKEFKAHKLILSMSSPVFATMFHGELCEKGDTKILDITPEAFSTMLEHMYTDEVNLKSFDHACEVCYAAKKYMLPALVKKCTTYIWSDIDPANTCRAYEFARLFVREIFINRCMKVIVNQTSDILNSSCFVEIDQGTLIDILNQDVLNISDEVQLFVALEKWIQYRLNITSDSLKDEDTVSKLQSYARPFLRKLRFLSMKPSDFATGPAQSLLLTKEDILSILMNISAGGLSHIPMPEEFNLCRSPRWYTRNKELDLAGSSVFWLQGYNKEENGSKESTPSCHATVDNCPD